MPWWRSAAPIWRRSVTETTRQREAFDLYWVLGAGRSIERLRDALKQQGKAPGLRTLYEWSRRHN